MAIQEIDNDDFQERLNDFIDNKMEYYGNDPVRQLRTYIDLLTISYVSRRDMLRDNDEFVEKAEAIELQLKKLWIDITPLFGSK
jgi:hypothetical protein